LSFCAFKNLLRIAGSLLFRAVTSGAGFVEFDWFSIVFGKFQKFPKARNQSFHAGIFWEKRIVRFSKMRGANIFSKCSTRQISFNKSIN
jgi:hypothetical protein